MAGTEVDRRGAPGTAVDGTAVVPAGTAVAGTPDVGAAVVLTPGGEAAAVVAGTEVDRRGAPGTAVDGTAVVPAGTAVAGVLAGDTAKFGSEEGTGT